MLSCLLVSWRVSPPHRSPTRISRLWRYSTRTCSVRAQGSGLALQNLPHCRLQSASFTNLRRNRLRTTWKRQGAAISKETTSPTTNLIQVWNHASCLEGARLIKFYHYPHPTGRTEWAISISGSGVPKEHQVRDAQTTGFWWPAHNDRCSL